jgi:hypothetical protein
MLEAVAGRCSLIVAVGKIINSMRLRRACAWADDSSRSGPVMKGWERKWERALLRKARDCSGLLMPATSELGKCGAVQVVASVLHSWGSRGRRFKSGRPDW